MTIWPNITHARGAGLRVYFIPTSIARASDAARRWAYDAE
jgi:hypothetical protein